MIDEDIELYSLFRKGDRKALDRKLYIVLSVFFIIAQLRRAVLPKFFGTVWAIREALGRTAHFLSVFAAGALAFFVHILYYRIYACFTAMRWPL